MLDCVKLWRPLRCLHALFAEGFVGPIVHVIRVYFAQIFFICFLGKSHLGAKNRFLVTVDRTPQSLVYSFFSNGHVFLFKRAQAILRSLVIMPLLRIFRGWSMLTKYLRSDSEKCRPIFFRPSDTNLWRGAS